ncbi:MAG: hypothetical protein M3R51_10290 [Candidatus Eremiobacteraeota bacterium]|nr:hypothetical protein [Candidatus Eremiobacteraeota bacterium]
MARAYANGRRFIVLAFALSLALHAVFALLVPTVAWLHTPGPTVERLSFVRVIRISVATPRPAVRPSAASAPQRAATPRILRSTPAHTHESGSHRRAQNAKGRSQAPVVAQVTPGAVSVKPAATGAPSSAPQEKIATAETHHDVGGYMPFGADVPTPVLDPGVVRNLEGFKVHVVLTIVVDENGRTKSVAFDPPLDASTENQMRAMLADASWDPAVCGGGVACEGRTTIKL